MPRQKTGRQRPEDRCGELVPEAGLFEQAREKVRQSIRDDREHVTDPQALRFLDAIERGLFQASFQLTPLRDGMKNGRRAFECFHATVGFEPRDYVRRKKLLGAAWLLARSRLKIRRIVKFAGYRSHQHFVDVFREQFGLSPSEYRKAHRGRGREDVTDTVTAAAQARREMPDATAGTGPTFVIHPGPEARRWARAAWHWLRQEPPEHWRRLARFEVRCAAGELFFVLGEAYLEESRKDRQRGVAVAELSRVVLEASAAAFGEEIHDRRAQASAWVANAKRLALDLPGAEAEMACAEAAWKVRRERWNHRVRAQILSLKAALRLSQRRFGEALELSSEAIALSRSAGALRFLAQSLIVRVSVILYSGQKEPTVSEAAEALRIAKQLDDRRLIMAAYSNHAMALIVAGEPEVALRVLREAEPLDKAVGNELFHYQLMLLAGLAKRGQDDLAEAERILQEAHDGFNSLGEVDHMAVVSIELAILHARQGRISEVLHLAAGVLPIFQVLEADPEAISALQMLREAIGQNQMSLEVLEKTRASLLLINLAPVGPFC